LIVQINFGLPQFGFNFSLKPSSKTNMALKCALIFSVAKVLSIMIQ